MPEHSSHSLDAHHPWCTDADTLRRIAHDFHTPCYVYSAEAIRARYHAYSAACEHPIAIHYAVKANDNLHILKLFAELGAGFDIVSQGELERVARAGGDLKRVVFSGVAKGDEELRRALTLGIDSINIESPFEVELIDRLARETQQCARVSIRVNPDVDAHTHAHISTGMQHNKFGIAPTELPALCAAIRACSNLHLSGLACHIGSQITELSPFELAIEKMFSIADRLHADEGIDFEHFDFGGGLGIVHPEAAHVPTPQELTTLIARKMRGRKQNVYLEPGRSLIGNAGVLLAHVVGVKEQNGRRFVFIDAGMNDYMRVALYQAQPHILNLDSNSASAAALPTTIAGPVCESGDVFSTGKEPFYAQRGDLLALLGVGAYGFSMSSRYNSRLRPAEVLLDAGEVRLIRRRERYADLWAQEEDLG